jgi:hypothetical protein
MDAPQIGSPVKSVEEYKDCQTGLLFFGLLQFGFAVLSVLMAAIAMWAHSLVLDSQDQAPSHFSCFVAGVPYLVIAFLLCWLGVGSILCRRWARALLLIQGWIGLVGGIASIGVGVGFTFLVPMLQCKPLSGAAVGISLVAMGIPGAMALALAGAMIAFYQNPNVIATCEARDPQVRWTDRCPLPLLAASLWICYGCLALIFVCVRWNSLAVVGTQIFSGWQGALLNAAYLGLWSYCGWAFYRQKISGWWIYLVTLVIIMAVHALTASSLDQADLYRHLNMRPSESGHLKELYQWSWLLALPKVGYLFWVKRFFPKA